MKMEERTVLPPSNMLDNNDQWRHALCRGSRMRGHILRQPPLIIEERNDNGMFIINVFNFNLKFIVKVFMYSFLDFEIFIDRMVRLVQLGSFSTDSQFLH